MNASDPHQSRTPAAPGNGRSGVKLVDVALAADALLREGLRPTIERIRAHLGRGSPNTINPLLDQWWKNLASRLSGGPDLLERIPPSAFHVLEALWVQLQMAARDRAAQELARESGEAARGAESLEIRSRVLSIRESELNERMRRQEERIRVLEDHLQSASLNLRRAEADAAGAQSRVRTLETELREALTRITVLLTKAVVRHRTHRAHPKKRKVLSPIGRHVAKHRKAKRSVHRHSAGRRQ